MPLKVFNQMFLPNKHWKMKAFIFSAILISDVQAQIPDTIRITFDSLSLKNKTYTFTPERIDLKKGQPYVFVFKKINTAYFTADINAQSLRKKFDLPAALQTIIPTLATTERGMVQAAPFSDSPTPLYKRVNDDFASLGEVMAAGDTLVKSISANQDAPESRSIGERCFLSMKLILLKNPSGLFSKNELKEIHSATWATDLQPFLNKLLIDFESTCSVVEQSQPLLQKAETVSIFMFSSFVKLNKDFLSNICNEIAIVQTAVDSIQSKPYQINGDYLRLKVNLFGNRSSGNPDTLLQTQIDFYRVHYWQLDISSGFFVNNLVSKSYYYTDDIKNYKSESGRNVDISVGALLHLNYVFSSAIKSGPVFGAGVSFLDGKTRYFGGWSFMIGRNNEFSLSFGAALSTLPVPSNAIATTEFGPSLPSSSVPTYDKLIWKGFLGITYCFTNKSK